MKNLLHTFWCAGALLVLALLVLIVSSCGGGGKLTVTPKVDVDVTPKPTMTMAERLATLGLGKEFQFFEAYPDGKFLRAEMKAPAKILSPGQKSDFGALQVWCKPYIVAQKKFVEKDITSFSAVTFSGTAGSPTPGGDRLLWQLYWHQIDGITDVSGTTKVLPDLFITSIWDSLNGGVLDSLKQDYDVKVTITDGVVKLSGSDTEWIGWAAAAFIGFCPQVTFTWPVDLAPAPPENQLPVAHLTVTPTNGVAPLTVHADGTASSDPDGTIVKFEWFFYGGGGHADVGGATMDNTYDASGDYSIWLRVTDDDGAVAWSSDGVNITVTDGGDANLPPVAVISTNPNPPSGEAPLTVNFDGSGSSDPDGTIVEYAWDFTDNQATDVEGVTTSYTYDQPGTYMCRLYVTDDDYESRSVTVTITVNPAGNENFTLFVAGIDGELMVGQTVHVMQGMGRAIANHVELRGDKGTTIPISLSEVKFVSDDLPDWVWDATTGELITVFWANPDNPDINDAGNVFITVTGDAPYPIVFTINHGGNHYSLGISLAVDANPAI